MARVQLSMSDADQDRFADEAQREGVTPSAWPRSAARDGIGKRRRADRFESLAEPRESFRECDAREGSSPERSGRMRAIDESRGRAFAPRNECDTAD